jgi:hypothetical protein
MAEEKSTAVRSHQQELEWLRKLGQGSLAKGVESLLKRDHFGNVVLKDRAVSQKRETTETVSVDSK